MIGPSYKICTWLKRADDIFINLHTKYLSYGKHSTSRTNATGTYCDNSITVFSWRTACSCILAIATCCLLQCHLSHLHKLLYDKLMLKQVLQACRTADIYRERKRQASSAHNSMNCLPCAEALTLTYIPKVGRSASGKFCLQDFFAVQTCEVTVLRHTCRTSVMLYKEQWSFKLIFLYLYRWFL